MEISRIRALRGPNLWTRNTAIEAVITCSEAELSIERLPEFERALRERFPDLPAFRPDPDGLVSLAHVVEIVTLSLQTMIGCPVTFSRTSRTVEPGVFQVVVEYDEESIGRQAIELAEQLCRSAGTGDSFTLSAALEQLKERYEDLRLGPSTGSIVNAALARDIPIRRLTEGSLVQFGWGSRQRRIQAAESDRTSAIAEAIAQDKELTKKLLHAAGISVPRGRPVDNEADAWQAALSLGGPVVVKPQDSNQGRGISVNVIGEQAVIAAYRRAAEVSTDVLVEEYLPGLDHRFLIVDGRLIAAARREPPQVTGDGSLTIAQLVEQVNADPRRGSGHATSLTKIPLDAIAVSCLAEQGYGVDSVLPLGVRVYLRNNANLSTGGTATDVTDDVHPELAASAVAAAHAVGLDICGIDVVCETVLRPLEDQGGGIVEVNAAPGLRMHLTPSFGKGRPVGEAVIAMMFPDPGDNGRIPVVAVAGTNGKTTTVRLIENILSRNGYRTGMTTTDGIYVEGQRIDTGDCSGPRSARNVLLHPDVDAAVFETARGGVLREGLGFDRCNVAVVTNIGQGDHLGLNYITTVEDLAVVKRVIVENVAPSGYAVLNAADPIVAAMAESCPGSVIFFARDRMHPTLVAHRANGRRVVYVDQSDIVASEEGFEHRLPLSAIPITRSGSIAFQVENAMAATAAAWALGLSWDVIAGGLGAFVNDAVSAPGRFNVFHYGGATLIADYGHNADAIAALVQAVDAMPSRRRSVVISAAGDRRDEDIRRQTEILGHSFDDVILYEDACQRGRHDGEVMALLREGLKGCSRTERVEEIQGEFVAIDLALSRLQPGDLCLILIDQVEEALEHIERRLAEVAGSGAA